ncbi:UNVERIFIED_CONTAM: BMP family ABC transporter substrate-binding protein [Halobacillus marinus]
MKVRLLVYMFLALWILTGCSENLEKATAQTFSAGLLVTESGLGDNAYSDSAFQGLEQARDELGITFDYREPFDRDYEAKAEEMIEQGHDVIIGLGYNSQPAIEALADKYPEQKFVLIDAVSEKKNVRSILFKDEEGSRLIGMIAGSKTKSGVVGFIGGEEMPVIQNFEKGFREGVAAVNPDAKVLTGYTGSFDDDEEGARLAADMADKNADFLFPAAGFAGIGVLKEAQNQGIYAFGVDTDQFFVAEDAVVSSMLKNVNVALYRVMKELQETGEITTGPETLGIKENGIGLAPVRIIEWTEADEQMIDEADGKE